MSSAGIDPAQRRNANESRRLHEVWTSGSCPDRGRREARSKDNEVLIKVRAASLNPLDWHFMRGTPYAARIIAGLRKPRFPGLGVDVAGQVEALGTKVS